MSHPNDVPPGLLLPRLATQLKSRPEIHPPDWALFAKTGVHRERAPTDPDWWFLRSASVLRKGYVRGHIGTTRLSAEYGGRRDRGSAPYHARTGSRSITREILQQLEASGLVQPYKNEGRRISSEGQKLLDMTARQILAELAKDRPELAKYL